jgi:hypothetical protein
MLVARDEKWLMWWIVLACFLLHGSIYLIDGALISLDALIDNCGMLFGVMVGHL